jgi:amino acid permease
MQVAQVLLTLPYSFAQLGFASGIVFQIFYGVIGCWSCYMITWLYVEYRTRKEREGVIFKNHVIQVRPTSCLWNIYIYIYIYIYMFKPQIQAL